MTRFAFLSRASQRAAQWRSDTSGNTAMLFGLSIVPVTALASIAIEYSGLESAQRELQQASDIAALTAASLADESAEVRAKAIFDATIENRAGLTVHSRTVLPLEDGYRVDAVATFDFGLGGMFGLQPASLHKTSISAKQFEPAAEIAIAHDITNSMAFGNGWDEAVSSIKEALTVMKAGTRPDEFHVAYVPYQDRVNVGTANDEWLKFDGEDAIPEDDDDREDFKLNKWKGCVEPREETIGGFIYALSEAPPTGDGKFHPTADGFHNKLKERGGKYPYCPSTPMQEPTPDVDDVADTLNAIKKGGTGRWDVGLAFAWRALSPEWRGHWGGKTEAGFPKNYGEGKKLLFFIMDGRSNAAKFELGADPNSYGNNNGTVMGWTHLVDLCQRIQDTGIELHVLHINPMEYQHDYMTACASSVSGHYHTINDLEDWKKAFRTASGKFGAVRLVR